MRFLLITLLLSVAGHGSGGSSAQMKSFVSKSVASSFASFNHLIWGEHELFLLAMELQDTKLLQDMIGRLSFEGDAKKDLIAHKLVSGNHFELLEFFIEHQIVAPDFSITEGENLEYRGSLLLRAVASRNLSFIKKIISLKGENGIAEIDFALRFVAGYDSSSPMEQGKEILAAFELRQLTMMELLIEGGADVNSTGEDHATPLTRSILSYQTPRVKFLLEQGAVTGDVDYALGKARRQLRDPSLEEYRWLEELRQNLVEIGKILVDNDLASASPYTTKNS